MAAIPECRADSGLGRFVVPCPCWPMGQNGGPGMGTVAGRARHEHGGAVVSRAVLGPTHRARPSWKSIDVNIG